MFPDRVVALPDVAAPLVLAIGLVLPEEVAAHQIRQRKVVKRVALCVQDAVLAGEQQHAALLHERAQQLRGRVADVEHVGQNQHLQTAQGLLAQLRVRDDLPGVLAGIAHLHRAEDRLAVQAADQRAADGAHRHGLIHPQRVGQVALHDADLRVDAAVLKVGLELLHLAVGFTDAPRLLHLQGAVGAQALAVQKYMAALGGDLRGGELVEVDVFVVVHAGYVAGAQLHRLAAGGVPGVGAGEPVPGPGLGEHVVQAVADVLGIVGGEVHRQCDLRIDGLDGLLHVLQHPRGALVQELHQILVFRHDVLVRARHVVAEAVLEALQAGLAVAHGLAEDVDEQAVGVEGLHDLLQLAEDVRAVVRLIAGHAPLGVAGVGGHAADQRHVVAVDGAPLRVRLGRVGIVFKAIVRGKLDPVSAQHRHDLAHPVPIAQGGVLFSNGGVVVAVTPMVLAVEHEVIQIRLLDEALPLRNVQLLKADARQIRRVMIHQIAAIGLLVQIGHTVFLSISRIFAFSGAQRSPAHAPSCVKADKRKPALTQEGAPAPQWDAGTPLSGQREA